MPSEGGIIFKGGRMKRKQQAKKKKGMKRSKPLSGGQIIDLAIELSQIIRAQYREQKQTLVGTLYLIGKLRDRFEKKKASWDRFRISKVYLYHKLLVAECDDIEKQLDFAIAQLKQERTLDFVRIVREYIRIVRKLTPPGQAFPPEVEAELAWLDNFSTKLLKMDKRSKDLPC